MFEVVAAIFFMGLIIFGMALCYKKRVAISKWLEDSEMAMSVDPKIKRLKLNYRINASRREMELLDEIEAKKEQK